MSTIMAIRLPQRVQTAPVFQNILSRYGCNIRTRIGLHDINETYCAPDGIIVLEVIGKDEIISSMLKELEEIKELQIKIITI